jgi:hypothetical protein
METYVATYRQGGKQTTLFFRAKTRERAMERAQSESPAGYTLVAFRKRKAGKGSVWSMPTAFESDRRRH